MARHANIPIEYWMISCEGALFLMIMNIHISLKKKRGLMDECQFDIIYLFEYGCWPPPVPPPPTAVLPPCPPPGE